METIKKQTTIRRPVARLSTTGQMTLLDSCPESAPRGEALQSGRAGAQAAPGEQASAGDGKPAVRFIDLDPHRMHFNDLTLRAYLVQTGLDYALVVRDVFDAMDFLDFEEHYKPAGRPPYSPRRMAALVVFGTSLGLTSLRQLEELAKRDLIAKWLTGGIAPDHATIGRFMDLHRDRIESPLFEDFTRQVLARLPHTSTDLAGDATVVEAVCSRMKTIGRDAAELMAEEAAKALEVDKKDPCAQALEAQAKACLEAIDERTEARKKNRSGDPNAVRVNPHEPEAVWHKDKRGNFTRAYIPGIVVNCLRVILGHGVHRSAEQPMVAAQLDQAQRILQTPVQSLSLDSNYFTAPILEMAVDRDLDLLVPAPEMAPGAKPGTGFDKRDFVYDLDRDHYTCPAGQTLTRRPGKPDAQRKRYRTEACKDCPLAAQCTKGKASRTLVRRDQDNLYEAMREVMQQPRAQERYAHRQGSVEPVFGELRNQQGLRRFRRKGLKGVRLEFAVHAMAHNLRRLLVYLKKQAEGLLDLLWACFGGLRRPSGAVCGRHGRAREGRRNFVPHLAGPLWGARVRAWKPALGLKRGI